MDGKGFAGARRGAAGAGEASSSPRSGAALILGRNSLMLTLCEPTTLGAMPGTIASLGSVGWLGVGLVRLRRMAVGTRDVNSFFKSRSLGSALMIAPSAAKAAMAAGLGGGCVEACELVRMYCSAGLARGSTWPLTVHWSARKTWRTYIGLGGLGAGACGWPGVSVAWVAARRREGAAACGNLVAGSSALGDRTFGLSGGALAACEEETGGLGAGSLAVRS